MCMEKGTLWDDPNSSHFFHSTMVEMDYRDIVYVWRRGHFGMIPIHPVLPQYSGTGWTIGI